MKFNDIKDKRRSLAKTPTSRLINVVTAAVVGLTGLFGAYICIVHSDSLEEIGKKINNFGDLERKRVQKQHKPLQVFEYRQYLNEKKAYQKSLEEETNLRLQKIREKINQSNTATSEPLNTSDKTSEQKNTIDSKESQDYSNSKRSLKSSILYYASFGFWNTQNNSVKSTNTSIDNTNKKN